MAFTVKRTWLVLVEIKLRLTSMSSYYLSYNMSICLSFTYMGVPMPTLSTRVGYRLAATRNCCLSSRGQTHTP